MANQAGASGQLMSCFTLYGRSSKLAAGSILYAAVFCLVAGSSCFLSSPATAKVHVVPSIVEQDRPDPDSLLIEVYKHLGANDLRSAQAKADILVNAYPNFRLGHLIRGDLLLMHGRPVNAFGAGANAPDDKLKDLRDEAAVRLKALRQRPDSNLIPRAILQLRTDQKFALLVDTRQSRLYVYQNMGDHLKLMTDYYITQGKLGSSKLKEGDQKTPLGVYHVTGRLRREKLPDFYGAGALPINYPNDWDKLNGRSGSGIWLHGTPSNNYSRPPLASDGCVVLTNPDLQKLYASVEVGKTPVIISDQVEFISKAKWDAERLTAAKLIEGWRRDVAVANPSRLVTHYSSKFKSDAGDDLNLWLMRSQQAFAGMTDSSVKVRDMTMFRYPGREDMIVSTFTLDTVVGKYKNTHRKRQYWAREGSQWKIVYEANL